MKASSQIGFEFYLISSSTIIPTAVYKVRGTVIANDSKVQSMTCEPW